MTVYAYRTKTRPSPRAVRWTGNYFEIQTFLSNRPFVVESKHNHIVFENPINPRKPASNRIRLGDWLIETEYGFDVISDETFRMEYEIIDEIQTERTQSCWD